jgi:transcriptional regulator GlxA family with amidase domain
LGLCFDEVTEGMKTVAVMLYAGCIYKEVEASVEALRGAVRLLHLSPDGHDIESDDGQRPVIDGSYAVLEQREVDCVLIPGGDPASIIESRLSAPPLQAAANRGALMAGICAGNLVLAEAGLLKDHEGTHNYTLEHAPREKVEATAPFWAGMRFVNADVVEDRKRITAQPWADVQLAHLLVKRLALDDVRIAAI